MPALIQQNRQAHRLGSNQGEQQQRDQLRGQTLRPQRAQRSPPAAHARSTSAAKL
jgi:hypothetical protein